MSGPRVRLTDRSIERLLLARSVEPDPRLLDEIIAVTANLSQRRAGVLGLLGRRTLALVAAALLVAVLAGMIALAARLPRPDPAPRGPAANGWIAYTDSGTIRLVGPEGSAQVIAASSGTLTCPTFAPDGSRLAYREAGDIRIVEVDETGASEAGQSIPANAEAPCAEWSPDGQALAFVHMDDVVIASVDGTTLTVDVPRSPASLAWTSDGSAILAQSGDQGQVILVPLNGSRPRTILQTDWDGDPSERVFAMEASPASPYLAVAAAWWHEEFESDGTGTARVESAFVRVIGLDGVVVFEQQVEQPSFFFSLAWSPDGKQVAWTDGEGIRIRSIDSATSVSITFGRNAVEGARGSVDVDGHQGLAWSPDGKWLLCEVSYTAAPWHRHAIVSVAADGSGEVIVHSGWRDEAELLGSGDLTWQRR